MPAERFYVDADLKDLVTIEGPEQHHLVHVMRTRIGDTVELVNGRGSLANAQVISISKRDATLEVLTTSNSPLPPQLLTLAIPLMRPAKLELVVEKCTELGANAFWFYPAQHSEKDDLSEHQQERLKFIAISAMKQCGRLDLPELKILSRFEEIFTSPAIYLFGDTRPNGTLIQTDEKIVFTTGPERGFSEKELKILDQKAQSVRLHQNILRAETAPIVAAVIYSK